LLHRTPPPPGTAGRLPEMRAPVKAALAVDRMRATAPDHPATATVLAAWRTIPADGVRGAIPHARPPISDSRGPNVGTRQQIPTGPTGPTQTPRHLCHGDFHLGQLVRDTRSVPTGPWRLIDIDDLGLGDPAWDLARPAAWFAAGILPPEVWSRFLGAYQEAGGPAVGADPWARLDVPARALTVQTAALALAKSTAERRPLDEVEEVMIDTCARIAGFRTDLAPSAST
ncbi:phosphotransferase, partial [Streptomyces sp. SR27]|uniref:phosphotransferase family protein n=1 Tax=Streptomyces sp. SR27 TaxID=3076630 RepID=UPI00295B0D7B